MLRFILPDRTSREDVLSFYREIEEGGGECIGIGNYRDFDRWLTGMQNRHTGENLPDGYVRENFYLCYDGDTLVGVFSLKFELTEFLSSFGGHIGYAVRPSRRRQGLATQMLRQGLALAQQFGFARVLCVCDEDNYASGEDVVVKRYWISL